MMKIMPKHTLQFAIAILVSGFVVSGCITHQPTKGKIDLSALDKFMSSETVPTETLSLPGITVRSVGKGSIIDEPVVEPDPRTIKDDLTGVERPHEPLAREMKIDDQILRVFNATTKTEYEIAVGGRLLEAIHERRDTQGLTMPNQGRTDPDATSRISQPTSPTTSLMKHNKPILASFSAQTPQVSRWVDTNDSLIPVGWSNSEDTRIIRTPTTTWPWRTIVHFSNGCSGTLIGPRHIITAAHCINKRGTNQWYTTTLRPGRDGNFAPFGDTQISSNPQPGDPFRWYFTPAQWRNSNLDELDARQWDWGLIIIPERLGDLTGWMGYVAFSGNFLGQQTHYHRAYPSCTSTLKNRDLKPNIPANCQDFRLYGDINSCTLGSYHYPGSDGWNRVIKHSCDMSAGHSGGPVYFYYLNSNVEQHVPVVSMVNFWENCYTCSEDTDFPNLARRITPGDLGTIGFFRDWKP